MNWVIIASCVASALGVLILFSGFTVVDQTERALVQRLGKYKRMMHPGLRFTIPMIDSVAIIPIVQRMVEAGQQSVQTKDNLNVTVDVQVYFQVDDNEEALKKSQYGASDYRRMIVNLSRTSLRNVIGGMTFEEAREGRGDINSRLTKDLGAEAEAWGITIVRTEIKEIDPPVTVQEAMNDRVRATQEKTAAETRAEGRKNEAEGFRMAAVKKAQGEKEATELIAAGKAKAIELVGNATKEHFKDAAVELKRLEVLEVSLKDNSKIIITEKGISPQLIIGELPVTGKGK